MLIGVVAARRGAGDGAGDGPADPGGDRESAAEAGARHPAVRPAPGPAELFARARDFAARGDWLAAEETLAWLCELAPEYPGARPLFEEVRARQAAVGPEWPRAVPGPEPAPDPEALRRLWRRNAEDALALAETAHREGRTALFAALYAPLRHDLERLGRPADLRARFEALPAP